MKQLKTCIPIPKSMLDDPVVRRMLERKLNGKWPTDTYLQRRLQQVRENPLYQNLYPPTIKEGGE